MSLDYCCLIAKKEKVIIAESNFKQASYSKLIMPTINTMIKGALLDFIELEDSKLITYFKAKRILFVCVSRGVDGKERPKRFMENFINLVNSEYGTIDNLFNDFPKITRNCANEKFETKFNKILDDFDTGLNSRGMIGKIQSDLDEIKKDLNKNIKTMLDNNNDLDHLLLVSKNINKTAEEYKEDAKVLEYETRCIKPWMIYVLIILIVLGLVYLVFALARCGDLHIFCER
jgi:hypothetical protein